MSSDPNSISKTFCGLAWTQIHVSPVGVVKPCCVYQGSVPANDGSVLTASSNNIEEIWNGDGMRTIRKKMLAGETLLECAKCSDEEKVHTISDRLFYTNMTPELLESVEYTRRNDGRVEKLPHELNLKVGNICNLKCRMCQPIDSVGIDSEFLKISKSHPKFRGFDNASAFDYYTNEEPIELMASWISKPKAKMHLQELLKNTRHLAYAGGEVTVTPEAMDLLRYCVDTGIAKNIVLDISTNLTKISDEFITLLSHFKWAMVACSIDGIGRVIEYIRHPSQWDVVLRNILKLLAAPENVVPFLAPTVQIYNVLNVIEILDFFEKYENKKWDQHVFCHLTILYSPNFLSIRNLPKKIKTIALKRVEDFYARSVYVKKDPSFKFKLELLMGTLREETAADGPKLMSHFVQYTQDLDESRGQKMKDYLPELAELLAQENIKPNYPIATPNTSFSFYKYKESGFLFQKKGVHDEAIKMFERAIALVPADEGALFGLGLSLREIGKLAEAEKSFRDLFQSHPGHYYNLLELGFLEKQRNNLRAALGFFQKAKEVEPSEQIGKSQSFIEEIRAHEKTI